jgi:hypothetical protein
MLKWVGIESGRVGYTYHAKAIGNEIINKTHTKFLFLLDIVSILQQVTTYSWLAFGAFAQKNLLLQQIENYE